MLHADGAWPVAEVEDPEAYVGAIRDVLADPVEARRRSSALRERLLGERSEEAFAEDVVELLLAPDGTADEH